jgi:diacylglycerol kinase
MRSFVYAWAGLKKFFLTEHNAWIHLGVACAAIILGFLLKLSSEDWIGVLFAIGLVLVAEAFNTCIEKMRDKLLPLPDKTVKYVKDLAAGGVLIAALTAVAIGLIIFVPAIMQYFGK